MQQNKEEYYFNSRLYDQKGNRIAVFGAIEGDKLQILELKCSKNDQFSKFTANWVYKCFTDGRFQLEHSEVFKKEDWHPKIHLIDIKEGDSAKYTFEIYCSENFYKKKTIIRDYEVDILQKGQYQMEIKNTIKPFNLRQWK